MAESLIVAARVKDYIKANHGLNCSDKVADALTSRVQDLCDDAAGRAKGNQRKTVLDKDI